MFAVSYVAQFLGPIDAKNIFSVWVFIKKYIYHSIIWPCAVLCKKQDCDWIKICEIFFGKSLKEGLSIYTTFDPCYFSWDGTFKDSFFLYVSFLLSGVRCPFTKANFYTCLHYYSKSRCTTLLIIGSCYPMKASVNVIQSHWFSSREDPLIEGKYFWTNI